MPWMHRCPALPKRAHRSQMVLISDDAELCGNCGQYRHTGRAVAVPASDEAVLLDPCKAVPPVPEVSP